VIFFPLSAVLVKALGLPVTLKPSPETTLLTLYALPLIFWQSVQWQSAYASLVSTHTHESTSLYLERGLSAVGDGNVSTKTSSGSHDDSNVDVG